MRGQTLAELEELRPRVYRCFEAGALATGALLEIFGGAKPYAEMSHDLDMAYFISATPRPLDARFSTPPRVVPQARPIWAMSPWSSRLFIR